MGAKWRGRSKGDGGRTACHATCWSDLEPHPISIQSDRRRCTLLTLTCKRYIAYCLLFVSSFFPFVGFAYSCVPVLLFFVAFITVQRGHVRSVLPAYFKSLICKNTDTTKKTLIRDNQVCMIDLTG